MANVIGYIFFQKWYHADRERERVCSIICLEPLSSFRLLITVLDEQQTYVWILSFIKDNTFKFKIFVGQ